MSFKKDIKPARRGSLAASIAAGTYRASPSSMAVIGESAARPKDVVVRDEGYRRLVAAMPCIACGVHGFSQAAHPNQGRGLGQKASDMDVFPLCCTRPLELGCHARHDQLIGMTLEERRARELTYIAQMLPHAELWVGKEPKQETDMIVVGIDPGVATGYAEWDTTRKHLTAVTSLMIHEAWERVEHLQGEGRLSHVVFEDARLRTGYFGEKAKDKQQGAGSVKRDCKAWADWLAAKGIGYRSISPKGKGKKVPAPDFKILTGWAQPTNEHGRDAAMLVLNSRLSLNAATTP